MRAAITFFGTLLSIECLWMWLAGSLVYPNPSFLSLGLLWVMMGVATAIFSFVKGRWIYLIVFIGYFSLSGFASALCYITALRLAIVRSGSVANIRCWLVTYSQGANVRTLRHDETSGSIRHMRQSELPEPIRYLLRNFSNGPFVLVEHNEQRNWKVFYCGTIGFALGKEPEFRPYQRLSDDLYVFLQCDR